jgi:uncharacterized membrane protein
VFFHRQCIGIGVGISVTDGGINGLVGVAIAASLLPPICNAGMCISYGLLSNNPELLDIGGFSLALFVINFVMIFLTGYGMFSLVGIASFRRYHNPNPDPNPDPNANPNRIFTFI